jgi:hypothetical protein
MPITGESDPELLVRIRMSPHHAKATAKMLTRIVEQYEANTGSLELRELAFEEDLLDDLAGGESDG